MRNTLFSLSICLASYAIPVAAHAQEPLVPHTVDCSTTDEATLRATKNHYDKMVAAAASGNALEGRRVMAEGLADTIHVTHLPREYPDINSGRGEAVWTKNELATVSNMEGEARAAAGPAGPPPAAGSTPILSQRFTSIVGNCVLHSAVMRGRNPAGEETLSLDLVIDEINKDGKTMAITHYLSNTGMIGMMGRPPGAELQTRIRAFLNDPKGSVVKGVLHRDLAGRK